MALLSATGSVRVSVPGAASATAPTTSAPTTSVAAAPAQILDLLRPCRAANVVPLPLLREPVGRGNPSPTDVRAS